MNPNPEEEEIRQRLDRYLKESGLAYYPDDEHVRKIIRKLAEKQKQAGRPYCPCRLVTNDPKADEKIVCPCAYHVKEIEERGYCCCRLFAAKKFTVIDGDFDKGGDP